MKNLRQIVKITERFTVDNAPTLMTGLGVAGVITTAILTAKAAVRAHVILEQNKPIDFQTHKGPELTNKEKALLVWKLYVPAVATGTLTCVSIVAANRVGMRRYAAMAAAYSISETAFGEYKDKVVEHMGKDKEQKVRDEVNQERVNRSAEVDREVILLGDGEHLFLDAMSGRTFKSDSETIRRIQNDFNEEILNGFGTVKLLSELYDEIGLPTTDYSSEVGWNLDNKVDFYVTSAMHKGVPVGVLNYGTYPIREYNKSH